MKKQYTVGDNSRRFLDALDTFQVFKNDLLHALTATYGEERGEQFYNAHGEQLEQVERIVMDYLRPLFAMGMGTQADRVEL